MATFRETQLSGLLDIASLALVADDEVQWWALVAELVLGVLFSADVMALNVLNLKARYGWFSVVHAQDPHPALAVDAPMDEVLLEDHPFSRRLALGPPDPVMKVTDLVSQRQWRDLASYERMLELTGATYHLTLHFTTPVDHQESLSIVRADPDFSTAETTLAAQLHSVLQLGLVAVRQRARLEDGHSRAERQTARNAARALQVTERERTVLELVAEGRATRGIAHTLGISPRTVYKHEQNIYRKLGVSDRINALKAAQHSLLLLPTNGQQPKG